MWKIIQKINQLLKKEKDDKGNQNNDKKNKNSKGELRFVGGFHMLTNTQIERVVGLFNESDTTLEMYYIMELLRRRFRYVQPNRIIRDALADGLLYVDTIRTNGELMLALTMWGEDVWGEL